MVPKRSPINQKLNLFAKAQRSTQEWVQLSIGLLISLLCVGLIVWLVDLGEVWLALQRTNYRLLVVTTLLLLLFLFLRALRWRLLLQKKAGLGFLINIQNIGYMLTMILPFRLGDVARIVLAASAKKVSVGQSASTLVVERLLDLLFFLVIFPFLLSSVPTLPPSLVPAVRTLGILSLIGVAILIVAANRPRIVINLIHRIRVLNRFETFVASLLDGLWALTSPGPALKLLFWSILIWLPIFGSFWITLRATFLEVPLIQVAFTVCIAAFGVAIPSSPGQIGVFHATLFFALATILRYPESQVVTFALLYHTLQFILYIFLGGIALIMTGNSWRDIFRTTRQNSETPQHNLDQT